MSWLFACTNQGRRWAVLHARVVVEKKQTLQKREGYLAIGFLPKVM
jgi:hypothetical protein